MFVNYLHHKCFFRTFASETKPCSMMKKKIFLLMLLFLTCLPSVVTAGDFHPSAAELLATGLTLVQIETVDGVEPTCDMVQAPEGCWGTGTTNKTKVPARMTLQRGETVLYDSGDYQADISGLQISIRGNSSAHTDKKPYKLKLQKKADLLLRGDKTYTDKQWLLLRDEDARSLKTLVGFKVGELVGQQWTPQFEYVNLMLNGDYKGVYMFAEAVREGARRLDVDKTSGYIIEYDAYWWNEDLCLAEGRWYQYAPMRYTFKFPDTDDITPEQTDYIQQRVDAMEQAVDEGTYDQQIDVASFATWLLAHDILGTSDNGGSNIFLTLHDNGEGSKFRMGNLWDMDTIERMKDAWAPVHIMWGFYFSHFFSSTNLSFMAAYKQKWDELSPVLVGTMKAFLDEFAASAEGKALDESLQMDAKRWNYTPKDFSAIMEGHKQWFASRKTWLDENVAVQCAPLMTGLPADISKKTGTSGRVFDLGGRRTNSARHGIVIKDGRKTMR